MARALRVGIDDETARRGGSLARTKYAAALLGGLLGGAACAWGHPLLSVFAFVLGFYAVEVQGVFLLPCLVTGDPSPLAGSRALVRRSGGTLFAIFRILPIAAWMLVGAFVRPAPNRFAFVRTWCEGCLAVVLWFEDLRRP